MSAVILPFPASWDRREHILISRCAQVTSDGEAIMNPERGNALMKEFPALPNRGTAAMLGLRAGQDERCRSHRGCACESQSSADCCVCGDRGCATDAGSMTKGCRWRPTFWRIAAVRRQMQPSIGSSLRSWIGQEFNPLYRLSEGEHRRSSDAQMSNDDANVRRFEGRRGDDLRRFNNNQIDAAAWPASS